MGTELTPPVKSVLARDAARRASDYGINLEELIATARRGRRGIVLVVLGVGIAVGVVLGITSGLSGEVVNLGTLILGAAIAAALTMGGYLIVLLAEQLLLVRLPIAPQQVVANVLLWGVTMLAIWGAVVVAEPVLGSSRGVLIGAIAWSVVPSVSLLSFPGVFRREHPQTNAVVAQYQQLPGWQTLLGGRVRWILVETAVLAVVSLCAAILFRSDTGLLVPITALAMVAGLVISWLGLYTGPPRWLAASALYCGIMIVAALLFGELLG